MRDSTSRRHRGGGPRRRTAAVGLLAVLLSWALVPLSGPASAAGEQRDLVFLVDGSGSISAQDWQIQKDGLAAALQDPTAFPRNRSIAVGVVQWSFVSAAERTRVEVPVTVLDGESTVTDVIAQVQAMAQLGSFTNPGDGIRRGTDLLVDSGEPAADWTLCMSTDGITNSGEDLSTAVAYARSRGVDKYSVVGIEDPPVVDAAGLRGHYRPHVYGGGSVTVARNAIEFANLIIGGCLGAPVQLRALEVTQAVQDWRNSVPLVTGKATAVRAYVQVPPGEPDARVVGRLYGRRGGADLPGSPLLAVNPGSAVLAGQDVASRRGTLADSLNFSLPSSWRSGTVELEFDAAGAPVSCAEPSGPGADPADNCRAAVRFVDEVTPETVFVGVRYRAGATAVEPSTTELVEQMFRFRSVLPVARLDWRLDRMGDYAAAPDLATVNSDLAVKRFFDVFFCLFGCSDDTSSRSRYYGVLRGNGGGLANDIPGTVSSGFLSGTGARGDTGYARNRGPHELAHNLGRHHAVDNALPLNASGQKVGRCNEVAASSAPGHNPFETVGGNVRPVFGPLSSGADNEVWGLDNRFLWSNTSQLAVVDPRATFELLSYCGGGPQGRWISRFTYTGLRGAFPASGVGGGDTASGTATGDHLVVTGRVDLATGRTTLGPVLEMTGAPPAPEPGDYEVQLRDASGGVLASASVAPEEMDADAPAPGVATGPAQGLLLVPLPEPASPVASVVVLHRGEVVGSRAASPTAPSVQVVRPAGGEVLSDPQVVFAWQGDDADRDALLYTVLYSADDGRTWDTLTVNTSATSLTVPRSDLTGSSTARLKVIVSDGVRTASATSAAFTVAGSGPVVEIDQPDEGQVFSGLQDVHLRAAAVDTEDGALAGAAIAWSSDRDGPLGTGDDLAVNASQLTEGVHVLTATATDGSGATGTDQVTVRVFRVAPPPPPPVLRARVEVKPGDDVPTINTRARGVVPVTVVTTDTLDATALDPATLCFGAAADPAGSGDCTIVQGRAVRQDVDGDGRLDLSVRFDVTETGLRPGDTEACLVGRTTSGAAVRGCDAIRAI